MIKDLKDLEKFIRFCRKEGVQSIKVGDIEFHLGIVQSPVATKSRRAKDIQSALNTQPAYNPGVIDENTPILMPDELTEEQLLHWSSGGDSQ